MAYIAVLRESEQTLRQPDGGKKIIELNATKLSKALIELDSILDEQTVDQLSSVKLYEINTVIDVEVRDGFSIPKSVSPCSGSSNLSRGVVED